MSDGLFGFLRCGEFTVKSDICLQNFIRVSDICFDSDKSLYTLILRVSKTDPFRHGVAIHIFEILTVVQ